MKRSCIHNSSLFLRGLWNAAYQQLKSSKTVGCSLQTCKGWFKIRFLVKRDGTVSIVLEALKLISISFPSLSIVSLATENNELCSSGLMIWNGSLQAAECWSQQERGSVESTAEKRSAEGARTVVTKPHSCSCETVSFQKVPQNHKQYEM